MILCCGESLIDMLPRTATTGEAAFAPVAGGAVFNTAIALGRLGAPAGFLGGISTDLFGEILERVLTDSKVDISYCPRSGRPTTLALVKLTDGHATYSFYDENTAGRMLTEADLPDLPESVGALFFGGISLVSEPAADTYAALMTREAGTRLTMIDPNIRPSFITDADRYRARIGGMLRAADIVKISDEDMAWITGDGGEAAFLEMTGAALVLLTRGAEGVTAIRGSDRVDVPAQKATVVDTVGAGDTFNAGLLAGLHRDGLLSRTAIESAEMSAIIPAVELGAAAAAITVSRAGANPPWAEELA
ncbi:carbohydrate kinase family protein [Mesobacterium pallidum]|uniref:carbohydrate kinase family protein n=1 Tax=Mesobacterium pallidum TaxID=2872037 RepID=UPI001EE15859|nr:carbohydrate kinase [Mesobacterium pallidum]